VVSVIPTSNSVDGTTTDENIQDGDRLPMEDLSLLQGGGLCDWDVCRWRGPDRLYKAAGI
jgi:hypothetical protein